MSVAIPVVTEATPAPTEGSDVLSRLEMLCSEYRKHAEKWRLTAEARRQALDTTELERGRAEARARGWKRMFLVMLAYAGAVTVVAVVAVWR